MLDNFTYDTYKNLIETGIDGGYEFLTVRDYLSQEKLPDRFIIMRHDIDRKPKNALDFARIEADAGVSSTHYFRAIKKTFKPQIIQKVEDLGHEVGYHYEDLDKSNGDIASAHDRFTSNLTMFREHVNVNTISMHGNPLTPHDNRDMWEKKGFDDYNLLGEVYLSVDFTNVVYFSDTNRSWCDEKTIVNDWPVGESKKPLQIHTTKNLIDLIEKQHIGQLYLLTHPNRWADTYPELIDELTKDTVINAGKYGLWLIRRINELRN